MCDSITGIAEGISAETDANIATQLTSALSIINLVAWIYLPLQETWSKTIDEWAEKVYQAQMNVPGNQPGTAIVASVTAEKSVKSTESDQEIGSLNTIIQGQKGMSQVLGNAMTAVFSLQEPINELLKAETDSLQQQFS